MKLNVISENIYRKSNTHRDSYTLAEGEYRGFAFKIVTQCSHPCAYVKLPSTHGYYGVGEETAYELPIRCHYGITFGSFCDDSYILGEGYWIGWDYAHAGDYIYSQHNYWDQSSNKKWTVAEIVEEVKRVIEQL